MGSRIQENIRHFFECFCEVVPPTKDKDAWIIQQYPAIYHDGEALKAIPKFAYPYKFKNTVVQHYSFVLTGAESKWTYGFCRHFPNSETAIVVLSYLPWHQAFYKLLDRIAELMTDSKSGTLSDFLSAVYAAQIADPGKLFSVGYNRGECKFAIEVPCPFQLPSIPENRNLTEYYNAVDTNNMMLIFASMLYERRIIVTSRKLNRLSACVQSANDIIYPMIWQHIFIPVLPMALVDYLLAPMPFLIGVPEAVLQKVNRHEIGEVVILDADSNTVDSPFDDLNNFPQEVITALRKQFKNKTALLGDLVPRAFLRALVQLIGGYRDGIRFENAEQITFDEEKFIESRPMTFQPFLREMLHLQIFQQFIEERLTMLNNGWALSDEFEIETFRYSVQSGSKFKQQYKEWTAHMRKDGAAFFKSVKEKANPAMKTAVKTVKGGSKGVKSAYKGLRSRLKDQQQQQPVARQLRNSGSSNEVQGLGDSLSVAQLTHSPRSDKPRSAPNSPTNSTAARKLRKTLKVPAQSSQNHISSERTTPASSPLRSTSPNQVLPRINLMDEMQDLLQLHLTPPSTADNSMLEPVRNLQCFSPIQPTCTSFGGGRDGTNIDKTLSLSFSQCRSSPSASSPAASSSSSSFFSSSSRQSPIVPPPLNSTACGVGSVDLFGTTPFICVAGGHSENGDALFLVGDQNSIDIVKLAPSPPPLQQLPPPSKFSSSGSAIPAISSFLYTALQRKQHSQIGDNSTTATTDLIHLDSSSNTDIDEFDPLKAASTAQPSSCSKKEIINSNVISDHCVDGNLPLSISNPLYEFAHINNNNTRNDNSLTATMSSRQQKNDQDLLQEYGLDFNHFDKYNGNNNDSTKLTQDDLFNSTNNTFGDNGKVNCQKKWTTFE